MHRTRLGLIASGLCTTTAAALGPPGPGSAVAFNDGLLTIPDAPALTLGASATIECWIRPLSTNSGQRFIEQGDGWTCESDRAFDFTLSPPYYPAQGVVTAWAFYRPGCTAAEAPNAWTLGEWTHVAMTVDTATLKHRLYINGVLANESPHYDASYIGRALGDSTRRLALGGPGDWPGHKYTGEMDELRIWNVARTQEEIAGAMSQHLSPTTPGLVAYFKFDEGSGASTNDATGNLPSGTLNAGVSWVTVPGPTPTNASEWAQASGGNGHWYELVRSATPVTWHQARDLATAAGGHLATPTSSAEDAWIRDAIVAPRNPGTGEDGPYIGGHCEGRPWGDWVWVTGEPWGYAGWSNGEPNSGGTERFVHYWRWAGLWWNDTTVDANQNVFSYVVEWDADCNGDGVVDYGQIVAGTLPDVNGNGVPDGCEGPSEPPANAVLWPVAAGGNGHWYEAVTVTSDLTWLEARDLARQRGGHLATPSTVAEEDWIRNQFLADTALWTWNNGSECLCRGPFIGATNPSGPWGWIDGSTWSYTNWYPGNPHVGLHAALYWDLNGTWGPAKRWGSTAPDNPVSRSYIIEWDADCNNDGLVDYGQILAAQLPDVNGNGVPDMCDAPPCNLADIASVGSTPPVVIPDGQLTLDDILVFINLFSDSTDCPSAVPCSAADVCNVGGPPGPPDGQLTLDDILAFVNAFSEGC